MFLTSQLLATLHPKIRPSKPKICLKMPSGTPKKGHAGPKIAQDVPQRGAAHTMSKPCILILDFCTS